MSTQVKVKQVDFSGVPQDNSQTRFLVLSPSGGVYYTDTITSIPTLQQVTDVDNVTTNDIKINSLYLGYGINLYGGTLGNYNISDASICAAIPQNDGTVGTGYSPGIVLGWSSDSGSNLTAGGVGSLAMGSVNGAGYLGTNGDATGGIAAGLVEDVDSMIQAVDTGAFARGVAQGGGSIIADWCGTAFGYANGSRARIDAGSGSLSIGLAEGDDSIINTYSASLAIGYASGDTLETTGLASVVMGRDHNNSGQYSMLFGRGLRNIGNRQFIFGYFGTGTNNSKVQLDDINQHFSITVANSTFYETRIKTTNLISHRNNEMPDADGTFALSVNGVSAGTDGSITIPVGTGTVTGVTATSPITSSGGTAPVISTSMATNKLIGRSSASTGVMEEITVGTGLSLSAGTLNATAQSVGFEQNFLLMGA